MIKYMKNNFYKFIEKGNTILLATTTELWHHNLVSSLKTVFKDSIKNVQDQVHQSQMKGTYIKDTIEKKVRLMRQKGKTHIQKTHIRKYKIK